jgi:hypothetical protein
VTLNIKEALEKAAQAQQKAQTTLDEITGILEKTKSTKKIQKLNRKIKIKI